MTSRTPARSSSGQLIRSQSGNKMFSSTLMDEQKKLERLKHKQVSNKVMYLQKAEIQTIVDYGFYLEEKRKKNEAKQIEAKKKEERIEMNKLMKSQEIHLACEIKDKKRERIRRLQSEELERKYREHVKAENEQRLSNEKKQKELFRESQQKLIEQQKNQEEFQRQVQEMLDKQKSEVMAKFEKLQKKDIIRKKEIEKRKMENVKRLQLISEENKRKLEKTLEKNDQILLNIRKSFDKKQDILTRIRNKFEEKKEHQRQETRIKSLQKEEEIHKVLVNKSF